jgi:hypothetical protein
LRNKTKRDYLERNYKKDINIQSRDNFIDMVLGFMDSQDHNEKRLADLNYNKNSTIKEEI